MYSIIESGKPPPIVEILNSPHLIYILKSTNPKFPNRTYVGYTVNLRRRLRQHNGIIKGGAKYTRVGRPYKLVCYIEGFPSKSNALQFEWRCHNPGGKSKDHKKIKARYRRYKGMDRRQRILQFVLGLEKWTKNALYSDSCILKVNWLDTDYRITCPIPHQQFHVEDIINNTIY